MGCSASKSSVKRNPIDAALVDALKQAKARRGEHELTHDHDHTLFLFALGPRVGRRPPLVDVLIRFLTRPLSI